MKAIYNLIKYKYPHIPRDDASLIAQALSRSAAPNPAQAEAIARWEAQVKVIKELINKEAVA